VKDSAPTRQDALKKFSKNARSQLEKAKQDEKVRFFKLFATRSQSEIVGQEAVDAAELIQHIKGLLRV